MRRGQKVREFQDPLVFVRRDDDLVLVERHSSVPEGEYWWIGYLHEPEDRWLRFIPYPRTTIPTPLRNFCDFFAEAHQLQIAVEDGLKQWKKLLQQKINSKGEWSEEVEKVLKPIETRIREIREFFERKEDPK